MQNFKMNKLLDLNRVKEEKLQSVYSENICMYLRECVIMCLLKCTQSLLRCQCSLEVW